MSYLVFCDQRKNRAYPVDTYTHNI
jgi:hypothetical protein